ncbi:MAG: ArsA family ATPase [Candidatus Microthrix subdominans]|nr:ArsA family ATPase [Candidatus Microthrix sp.]MBK6971285.1 ArsA family ATPase [Candidatus Microthrix sp.]MBK9559065.1 ArsA family ATPase [Candidatus Microthrix sp.]
MSDPGTNDAPGTRPTMAELIDTAEVIVCCGSGGVGKTTTAAIIGLSAARRGRRAVVVTIDPARRLADALGLDHIGATASLIDGEWPGELSALMLDAESTFDLLVERYAASDAQALSILSNSFYRNISGTLSGTQEYMASEKLYELHQNEAYDLVVVDTPPTRNALDFLEAPERLSRFLNHRIYRAVTAPSRGVLRVFNAATSAALRQVGKVVGSQVISDAVAFFQAFEGMEEGFRQRATSVTELFADEVTAFVLVTAPREDSVAEASFFAQRLAEDDIDVRALIVNRMHPPFGEADPAADEKADGELRGAPGGAALADYHRARADLRRLASEELANLAQLTAQVSSAVIVYVPSLATDVHDVAGPNRVGESLLDPDPA